MRAGLEAALSAFIVSFLGCLTANAAWFGVSLVVLAIRESRQKREASRVMADIKAFVQSAHAEEAKTMGDKCYPARGGVA